MEKYLEEKELLQIENDQQEVKIQKLEHMLLDKNLKELVSKQEILKLKTSLIELEKLKLQINLEKKSEKIKKAMKKSKDNHEKLEEKYDLKKGWGFNPDTLEIIQKEE